MNIFTIMVMMRIPRAMMLVKSSLSSIPPKEGRKLANMVMMRIAKAMMFVKSSLSSIPVKEGRKLDNMVNKKTILIDFTIQSSLSGSSDRSTGSFSATAINVMEVALRVKNLHGNQSFRWRKPWKTSAAIARVQRRDAIATYSPTHGMASFVEFILLDKGKMKI
ncbi:hypothetical protein Ccrd_021899 [Cynara cardunculus var. scolymus]|uniref:Uncharacterized protein n=1 Tax=Cynara cardunculus var. scolymus TaxID=59895 RepID=A0A103XZR8_CYNCS|nr:hypothetical protein Ccrd_021899 [Cynara cardunculus var. scolymus]